mgnify:CR=1 FL=1
MFLLREASLTLPSFLRCVALHILTPRLTGTAFPPFFSRPHEQLTSG